MKKTIKQIEKLSSTLKRYLKLQKRLGLPPNIDETIRRIEDLIVTVTIAQETIHSVIDAMEND